ncbi:MAG: DUF4416 family protein [Planctomycetes bacterium]|nr:DUF4416 family protein [Planctomycetota bacterium]
MWDLNKPNPVKLIVGILAADEGSLQAARESIAEAFGPADMVSEVWPFTQTDYYKDETGESILRMFVAIEKLIDPGELAEIKHTTNRIERDLAEKLGTRLARPVNLDPGIIEPSKLVLASTKNFSHRIYIGDNMYAEVTLTYSKGEWIDYRYTFADYKQRCYHEFFSRVRERLVEQIKNV